MSQIRRILRTTATIAAFAAYCSTPAMAERTAIAGHDDHRIKTVNYAERDVVSIHGHYGFSTTIEFAVNETVLTVSIGDSEAWQVVKPKQPNLLFIKPVETKAHTNMTVVTDKRIYVFDLDGHKAKSRAPHDMTFHVKFNYPHDKTALIEYEHRERQRLKGLQVSESNNPDSWNFDYTFAGNKRLRPTRTFDDGIFTYFAFPDFETLPAIFVVNEDGTEAIVNYQQRDKYVVVERLARQFTLRDGDDATCIFNEAFPQADYDLGSPQMTEVTLPTEPVLAGGPRAKFKVGD